MNSWLEQLMQASAAFDRAFNNAREQQKNLEMSKNNEKQKKQDKYSQQKLMQIDFESQDTLQYFSDLVPEGAFNEKLFADTQNLKIRHIPTDRKVKLFGGFLAQQQNKMELRKKQYQNKISLVPQQWKGKAQFTIQYGNNTERFTLANQDLQKLNQNVDINDTILENYFKFLKMFVIPEQVLKKTYFFSTFFMSQLMGDLLSKQQGQQQFKDYDKKASEQVRKKVKQNYSKVKRWNRKANIFDMDYFIVPINASNHWNCLLVVNPNTLKAQNKQDCSCKIIGLDSMTEIKTFLYDTLKFYLQQEILQKYEKIIDIQSIQTHQILVPRQTNHHDCGLYVLSYIQALFSEPQQLKQIEKLTTKNFLRLFPRQIVYTMRTQLKNLLFNLMKNTSNSQKVLKITQYFNQRKRIIKNQVQNEYDIINEKYFEKYCKLSAGYSEETEFKILIRFYLDSDINYYEKNEDKDMQML